MPRSGSFGKAMSWLHEGLLVACAAAACAGCTTETPAAEAGAAAFNDPHAFSRSEFNNFSCATCHLPSDDAPTDRRDAGYSLEGVVARTAFWGGNELRLQDAVDACVTYFMRGTDFDPQADASRQLYEYLESITPTDADPTPLPFTVVENIVAIPAGDATRGETLYVQACQQCHGAVHTGEGNIIEPKPIVMPEYTDGYDMVFPGVPHGLVVIEKIRHGRFFNVGGTMAPFSKEAMTDEEIGDLLAFLGLTSEADQ